MFFAAAMFAIFVVPIFTPLFEAMIFGMVVYVSVSHPVPWLPNWPWSLGAHPVFGISAAIIIAYYYFALYRFKTYTIIVGGTFSIIWSLFALRLENNGRKIDELVLSLLQGANNWSSISSPQGAPAFLLAGFILLISITLRIFLYKTFKVNLWEKKSAGNKIAPQRRLTLTSKKLAVLLVFSTICFILLKACSSSPGIGR